MAQRKKTAGRKATTRPSARRAAARQVAPPRGSPSSLPNAHREDQQAIALVMQLMALPGVSGSEGQVARFIENQLLAAGAQPQWLKYDTAHRSTQVPGEVGNLCLKLPGSVRAPRRLLMAHMDTVPVCVGSRPQRDGDLVRSADPHTGLGADDRAGAAVVLLTALRTLRSNQPHPPLTFLWTIQEEIGLQGARHLRPAMLGRPALAFNWDGGAAHKVTLGATGGYRMQITVEGLASHAGNAPEQGISAVAIASLAIADLTQHGWHGAIEKRPASAAHAAREATSRQRVHKAKRQAKARSNRDTVSHDRVLRGTSNVGVIQGGTATNVVTDRVVLRAEARSHHAAFREQIVQEFHRAFERAVAQLPSADGSRGKVTMDGRLDYEAFRLEEDHPVVQVAMEAVREEGLDTVTSVTNGGIDANWMFVHGIPTVTLGCGQLNPHTVSEALDLIQFQRACRIAGRLAAGTAGPVAGGAPP